MKDTIRARYTFEFKQEAIRLVQSGERVSTVATTLGVSSKSIDNWIKDEASGIISTDPVKLRMLAPTNHTDGSVTLHCWCISKLSSKR